MRILLHRRHSRSIRHLDLQSGQGDKGFRGPRDSLLSVCGKALRQVYQFFFKFTAENCRYAERTKLIDVHGGVQAITAEMRAGILFPQQGNELRCQPRGRMHWQIDRHQLGVANRSLVQ